MHIKQEITRDELEAFFNVLEPAIQSTNVVRLDKAQWSVMCSVTEILTDLNRHKYSFKKPTYKLKFSYAKAFALLAFMENQKTEVNTEFVLVNGILIDIDQKLTLLTKGKRV